LADLEHKGADSRTVRASAYALLNLQLVHIRQALEVQFGAPRNAAEKAKRAADHAGTAGELIDGVEALTNAMIDAVENFEHSIIVVGTVQETTLTSMLSSSVAAVTMSCMFGV
jgi:hypothetical protein